MRKGTFLSYFLYDPWHQSNALFLSWSCDGGDSKERIKEDKYTNASSRSWDAPPLYNSNKLMSCKIFFNFNGIELHYICDSLSHSSLSYLHRTTKMKSISVTHHILHTKHKQHQVIIEKYEPLANLDKQFGNLLFQPRYEHWNWTTIETFFRGKIWLTCSDFLARIASK